MTPRFAFPLILLLLGVSGCSLFWPDHTRDELEDNRQRWAEQGYDDYQFTFHWRCFCGFQEVNLVVLDGVLVSGTQTETGEALDEDALEQYRTIEGLFDFFDEARDRDAHEIEAEYHPDLGYPTSGWVDYEKNTIDEELGFEVQDLVPLR